MSQFPEPMPDATDAEQALLGGLLMASNAIEKLPENFCADDFTSDVHGQIFSAIQDFAERGITANPVTLKTRFENDPCLTDLGGAAYLVRLAGAAINIINIPDYAQVIAETATRQKLIQCAEEMARNGRQGADIREMTESIEARIYELASRAEGGTSSMGAAVDEAIASAERAKASPDGLVGLATGINDLDDIMGGMEGGNLIVVGGRPGMGKTSLALTIAAHVGRHVPIGFFSLEMKSSQLANRLIAASAGIDQTELARGKLSSEGWAKAKAARLEVSRLQIIFDDTTQLHIGQIRTRARRMQRRHGIKLLVLDHMGLAVAKAENRVQEMTKISGALKSIARELEIPVLALCQLNRQVEGRDDKRPHLFDLRDSGSIEQDADQILLLYRDAYYLEQAEPKPRPVEPTDKFKTRRAAWQADLKAVEKQADVFIAKNRHGPLGRKSLFFNPAQSLFGDRERDYEGPA